MELNKRGRGFLCLIVLLMALVCVIILYKSGVSRTMLRNPTPYKTVPDRFPTAEGAMDAAVAQSSLPDELPATSVPSHYPYLIALKYEEQLQSATRNVFQLVNLTVHWNRRAVEPFIAGSTYSEVPSSPSLSGLFRFGDFYNISSVVAQMGDCFSEDLYFCIASKISL